MERAERQWDDHLEEAYEEREAGGERDEGIDPELEAWLRAREVDLEEQRFALADQFDEEWR